MDMWSGCATRDDSFNRKLSPIIQTLTFHEGLNVLLADTHPTTTDRHTRNSAGKTSLIEIIHFLHGADCNPDSIFRSDALVSHSFKGALSIRGEIFEVQRTGGDPGKVFLLKG